MTTRRSVALSLLKYVCSWSVPWGTSRTAIQLISSPGTSTWLLKTPDAGRTCVFDGSGMVKPSATNQYWYDPGGSLTVAVQAPDFSSLVIGIVPLVNRSLKSPSNSTF